MSTFSTTHLICPYCGNQEEVDFETFYGEEMETEQEFYCEQCDHVYYGSREVSFSYETRVKEEQQ